MGKRNEKEKEFKGSDSIEPTSTWINKTSSGKGFIIYVKGDKEGEDFHEGDILLGSIKALEEFIDGERKGINLGRLIPDEE